MSAGQRLFVKVTRESLPQVKDKYPFIYLERGRLEIDDSSIKWIDADCNIVPLPVATLNALLLGPGTCRAGEDETLVYRTETQRVCFWNQGFGCHYSD